MNTTQKLRIGIIGCGNIGTGSHLPAWLHNSDIAEVVALADPSSENLTAAASAAGLDNEQLHVDPFELIARADIDAIDICTPQHLRRDLIVAAAEHGLHVLCEKPLATTPMDASVAVAAMEARGLTLAMVHNYLWLPEVVAAQQVIESGEIGAIRTVIINALGIVDSPGAAAYSPRWRHDAAVAGGGVLIDILHDVYLAESFLGDQLVRVSGYVDASDPQSTVEDLALCRYETSRNVALVNIAWGLGPGGIQITGTEGRIAVAYRDGGTPPWAALDRVTVTTATGTRVNLEPTGQEEDGMGEMLATFRGVTRDFARALSDGSKPRATGADGKRILEATIGALKSAAAGTTVEIPLDRSDPVFENGALGVSTLDLPSWSPVLQKQLYQPMATQQIGELA